MIAHGDHISTGVKDLFTLLGCHAHCTGIFTVDDDKIRAGLPLEIPQRAADPIQSGFSYHITHCQNLKIHASSSLSILFQYIPKFRPSQV